MTMTMTPPRTVRKMLADVLAAISSAVSPASALVVAQRRLARAEVDLLDMESHAEQYAHSVKMVRARVKRLRDFIEASRVPPMTIERSAL